MDREIETRAEALQQTAALLNQLEGGVLDLAEGLAVVHKRLALLAELIHGWATAEAARDEDGDEETHDYDTGPAWDPFPRDPGFGS